MSPRKVDGVIKYRQPEQLEMTGDTPSLNLAWFFLADGSEMF
jgi:hypothetical protein